MSWPRSARSAPGSPSAQAQRERAEAELHQSRADMHERGLADDQLDDAPEPGRFERDPTPSRDPESERTR